MAKTQKTGIFVIGWSKHVDEHSAEYIHSVTYFQVLDISK